MDSIKVSVIGLRGHAGLHIKLLQQNPNVVLDKVFYHLDPPLNYDHLPVTNTLSDCLTSDVIIVSTPTSSHFNYIKSLSDYPGYIFLEKPAANRKDDMSELSRLPASLKSRIRINFNFGFHSFADLMSGLISGGQLGKIFSFDVHTSHGVAFRQDWGNTWRVDNETHLGPLETTGIHYVQFCLREFGACIESDVHTACLSGRPSAVDTGLVNMKMADGTWVRIRHSYAAPYAVRFELWGTEGYLVYEGKTATLYFPRDTFDSDDRFTTPPIKSAWEIPFQPAWSDSLLRAQQDFLNVVQERALLDPSEFDRDVAAMDVLLDGQRRNLEVTG